MVAPGTSIGIWVPSSSGWTRPHLSLEQIVEAANSGDAHPGRRQVGQISGPPGRSSTPSPSRPRPQQRNCQSVNWCRWTNPLGTDLRWWRRAIELNVSTAQVHPMHRATLSATPWHNTPNANAVRRPQGGRLPDARHCVAQSRTCWALPLGGTFGAEAVSRSV